MANHELPFSYANVTNLDTLDQMGDDARAADRRRRRELAVEIEIRSETHRFRGMELEKGGKPHHAEAWGAWSELQMTDAPAEMIRATRT